MPVVSLNSLPSCTLSGKEVLLKLLSSDANGVYRLSPAPRVRRVLNVYTARLMHATTATKHKPVPIAFILRRLTRYIYYDTEVRYKYTQTSLYIYNINFLRHFNLLLNS